MHTSSPRTPDNAVLCGECLALGLILTLLMFFVRFAPASVPTCFRNYFMPFVMVKASIQREATGVTSDLSGEGGGHFFKEGPGFKGFYKFQIMAI